jgi:uncharacterized protein YndB with AHSA1/START domain
VAARRWSAPSGGLSETEAAMASKFTVSATIPSSPEAIYAAWLDGKRHGAMTGAAATGRAKVGATFTAWDGYASGRNLDLDPGKRIVQSWRTTDFAEDDPDSTLVVTLSPVAGGTKVKLTHSKIPDGQPGYRQGWIDFYFAPMKEYFAGR